MSGPASRAPLLPPFVAAAVLACGVVLLRFAVQGRTGLNPADEGFFWYGVQRVLHGEVPIRDFMAYDIGRYYVSAAGLWLAGDDGVVALRVVVALFQALVLALVLRAAMGWERRWPVLLAIALVLALWMWHWFRIFDYAASLLLFCAAAWLAAAPGPRRALVAGVVLGAVATIGRNHGVYGAFGLAVVALAATPGQASRLRVSGALAAGTLLGYLPMVVLFAADAGFRVAFVAEIREMLAYGATNLELPVPWPHRAFAPGLPAVEMLHRFLLGCGFVALPLFVAATAVRAWRHGVASLPPALLAAAALALPYSHFAFSRADLDHLAAGIFPLLMGLFAWPTPGPAAPRRRAAVAAAVLAGSALLLVPVHPAMLARAPGWVTMDVGGDRLLVPPNMAKRLQVVAARLEGRAPGSGDVLVAPHWVTMYAVHRLRSPVWEIYGLFPRGPRFEAAEIARMEAAGVDLAIIQTHALDGRDALLYRNTHPLTWRWLQRRFRRVDSDAGVETWVRRDRVATAEAAR